MDIESFSVYCLQALNALAILIWRSVVEGKEGPSSPRKNGLSDRQPGKRRCLGREKGHHNL